MAYNDDRSRRGSPRPRDRSRDRMRDRPYDRPRDHNNDRHAPRSPLPRGGTPHDRRDRSRSPRRERGGRRGEGGRYRSRSPIPRGEREREARGRDARDTRPGAPPMGPKGDRRDVRPATGGGAVKPVPAKEVETRDVPMAGTDGLKPPEGIDEDTWEMIKVMGFGSFKTTKETKVPGNEFNYGVRKDKVLKARQYMNRQGGFNRPLSPTRG